MSKGLQPQHDSHNSSTQAPVKPSGGAKPYTSGANVGSGKGRPSPSKPGPASEPKQSGY